MQTQYHVGSGFQQIGLQRNIQILDDFLCRGDVALATSAFAVALAVVLAAVAAGAAFVAFAALIVTLALAAFAATLLVFCRAAGVVSNAFGNISRLADGL